MVKFSIFLIEHELRSLYCYISMFFNTEMTKYSHLTAKFTTSSTIISNMVFCFGLI